MENRTVKSDSHESELILLTRLVNNFKDTSHQKAQMKERGARDGQPSSLYPALHARDTCPSPSSLILPQLSQQPLSPSSGDASSLVAAQFTGCFLQ